jgi:hypothetical protein
MMAELENIVSSQDENTEGFFHQRTLLPAPATKGVSRQYPSEMLTPSNN